MCVSVPYRVVAVAGAAADVVSRDGRTSTVSLLAATDPVAAGDWVLVHSGFVLARLTDADVQELDEVGMERGTR